ncbi:MAG: TIGR02680 family protein [Pseudonocardiales bacterium]|nr:MAG: TIGR02680 family protein [Pseudonocardiales bacterium]
MARDPHRFRLHRAGILNVWQYDDQVFTFCDGRLLLRGTNGAGKSKTMEMLLPFVLDGDKARMAATGRQGSPLLWLMSDGASTGGTRTGYLWVEFVRVDADGARTEVTCGVGIRHSASARQATIWQFTVPTAVPALCEADGTPLSAPRCRELVESLGGRSFESPRDYKRHVGRLLFGLEPQAYDDLLRLLYWLRQPQVGEEIDPARLVGMLDESLPALDEDAVRQVGEAFDDLAGHGERLDRLRAAAQAVDDSARVYARYAATLLRDRASAALAAEKERAARARAVAQEEAAVASVAADLIAAEEAETAAGEASSRAAGRVRVLQDGPLARNQQVLREKQRRAEELAEAARVAAAAAERAAHRAQNSAARVAQGRTELSGLSDQLSAGVGQIAGLLRACALDCTLPSALAGVPQATALGAQVPTARQSVSTARVAVMVVRDAAGRVERATAQKDAAAQRAAEAEGREEQAAGRLADSERAADRLCTSWSQAAAGWAAERPDLDVVVPVPGPVALAALRPAVRAAVSPVLQQLGDQRAAAAARRTTASGLIRSLQDRRAQVLAERDRAPPPPPLPRPSRDQAHGLPLWRLIDVVAGVDAAPLEAALQSAGLLDAQVLADGSVLRPSDVDTVLTPLPLPSGATLRDAFVADVPSGSPVAAEVVVRLLGSVLLADTVVTAEGPPAIGRDGSWRLGPLVGRAGKPVAQYIGSAAREAERARRLADIDGQLAAAGIELRAAAAAEEAAAQEIRRTQEWEHRLPSWDELGRAWIRIDERAAERDRAHADAERQIRALNSATEELARHTETLRRLCAQHDLPADRAALDARDGELVLLDQRLQGVCQEGGRLLVTAQRLEEDGEAAERDEAEAVLAADEASSASRTGRAAAEEAQALLDTLGVEVQRMQAELDAASQAARGAREALDRAVRRVRELAATAGEHKAQLTAARQRLSDSEPEVVAQFAAVGGLRLVPGLVDAGLGRPIEEADALGLDALDVIPAPRAAVRLLSHWAQASVDRPVDANAVHAEVRLLAVGPAADAEPRVVPVAEALSVLARDSAGAERPLADLAVRMAAEVTGEQELLTEREHQLFEEHLLGELGDALRSRRQEAADLVMGMNELLADVRTSQGIRVRLDWDLRDDVGAEVRDAVALLGRARGSLTPEESDRLRDALGALIEVQRSAEPERGYAEHLARALDYRRWSAFSVKLHRPGTATWSTLTRRTPLSQGEQKVVCYLPLFAAAAAHFSSVAGAAPYAPRLILLDDAFPKIDVGTHPLLFGLLVDLDLDFVLTSERLWGDHATVPSLAVYEALRAPGERGIAQYRYTWDGRVLVGEG